MDQDLFGILFTLFVYSFFSMLMIMIYIVVSYINSLWTSEPDIEVAKIPKRKHKRNISVKNGMLVLEKKDATALDEPLISLTQLPKNICEGCGGAIPAFGKNNGKSAPRAPTMGKVIKNYDPLGSLNIANGFTSYGLGNANVQKNDLKDLKNLIENQEAETMPFQGLIMWLKSVILLDEASIKKACNSDGIIYLSYLKK